jgi:hypothetical protein
MTKNNYVFFHVGTDNSQPEMLVQSIRWTDPDSEIIQVSDFNTQEVYGVSKKIEIEGDTSKLMSMRIDAFGAARLQEPAIYIDTDMLVLSSCTAGELIKDKTILLCKRVFDCSAGFNGNFMGLDYMEYHNQPLGKVYPFLACATVAKSYHVWQEIGKVLRNMHPKFHIWYGDQEALKLYYKAYPNNCSILLESEYGCLPEYHLEHQLAKVLHFKGARRKFHMIKAFESLKEKAMSSNRSHAEN